MIRWWKEEEVEEDRAGGGSALRVRGFTLEYAKSIVHDRVEWRGLINGLWGDLWFVSVGCVGYSCILGSLSCWL